jgi:glycosyltransferase involved in cell wall biosynthesis
MEKLNIFFFSRKEIQLDDLEFNSGIGGTEYAVLCLANDLGRSENIQVNLIPLSPLVINGHVNFDIINSNNIDRSIPSIVCESYLDLIKDLNFRDLIIWIHHPNLSIDKIKKRIVSKGVRFVGLSIYQFNKRQKSRKDLRIIPGTYKKIFKGANHAPRVTPQDNKINFVFLGALTPQKGFHHVARYWRELSKLYPDSKLHVIGAGSLYDGTELGKKIPAELSYEKKLLEDIPSHVIGQRIIFYGLVRELNDLLGKMDIGLLNPFASTEAYPDSILKLYEFGIPVISGLFNGSREFLRVNSDLQFPNILPVNSVKMLLDPDQDRYHQASQNVIRFLEQKESNDEIIEMWKAYIWSEKGDIHRSDGKGVCPRYRVLQSARQMINIALFRYKYNFKKIVKNYELF